MKTSELLALPHEEINAIVAEQVAGMSLTTRWISNYPNKDAANGVRYSQRNPPNYTTSMDLCINVADKTFTYWTLVKSPDGCNFYPIGEPEYYAERIDTPQLAIIVAALKAKGFLED